MHKHPNKDVVGRLGSRVSQTWRQIKNDFDELKTSYEDDIQESIEKDGKSLTDRLFIYDDYYGKYRDEYSETNQLDVVEPMCYAFGLNYPDIKRIKDMTLSHTFGEKVQESERKFLRRFCKIINRDVMFLIGEKYNQK